MDTQEKIAHFLKYNNTVPIVLGILFLSTSATMAASPAVRDSVYAQNSATVSVDNSYLLAMNFEEYPFAVQITTITEDDEYFYATYLLETIAVEDGVWQEVTQERVLRVSKALLRGGDLEAYINSELSQVRSYEQFILIKSQEDAKKAGMTQKVVTTEFSGVVGKFFEPTKEISPQYISEIDKDDPLYLKRPKPSLTWDADAIQDVMEEDGDQQNPQLRDKCPDIGGIQLSASDCPPDTGGGGGEEPPAEEPLVEELPVEEPPVEEPPAEEPPVEEPPAEEPTVEEPPAPQEPEAPSGGEASGGETGGESGGGE